MSPVGLLGARRRTGTTIFPNLTGGPVCWIEYSNMWIGPGPIDLIKFGAFYPVCMRFDPSLYQSVVQRQRAWDRVSKCCLHTDSRACYQTSVYHCRAPFISLTNCSSKNAASPKKKSKFELIQHQHGAYRIGDRKSCGSQAGPVCGLDRRYCVKEKFGRGSHWSQTDVTMWPICEQTVSVWRIKDSAQHMRCEVTAHPCCINIQGECMLTTKKHCDLIGGKFNPKAALCSQIDCLEFTCGMTKFRRPERPDQLYRVLTSLCLHAGFLQLGLSILFELSVLRTIEQRFGWLRVAGAFIFGGCIGQLFSGSLLPYQLTIGPSAALISTVSIQLMDILLHDYPARSKVIYVSISAVFFIPGGFLPWTDNLAHLGGFVSGLLFYFVLLVFQKILMVPRPAVSHHQSRFPLSHTSMTVFPRYRVRVMYILSTAWVTMFLLTVALFIFGPIINCAVCVFISCLPLNRSFCEWCIIRISKQSECTIDL